MPVFLKSTTIRVRSLPLSFEQLSQTEISSQNEQTALINIVTERLILINTGTAVAVRGVQDGFEQVWGFKKALSICILNPSLWI